MVKLDEHLYQHNDTYIIMLGYRLQSKNKQLILKAYDECKNADFRPSLVNKILDKYRQYKQGKRNYYRVIVQKNNNHSLYIEGFYIGTDTPSVIQRLLQEYEQSSKKDVWLDDHVYSNHKQPNTGEAHVYMIQGTGKYRVTKYNPSIKRQVYYGEYDTLEEAILVRDKQEKEGWQIPPRKRKEYTWDNLKRYIHESKTGKYIIKRNGQHYGTWNTLQDAVDERDWLIENNWSYDNIDLY